VTPFGRLFAASAISNLGDGLRMAALPLLAASLTRDPTAIAAVVAVIWLPWLLFGTVGGAIVDRVSRVRLLAMVQIGRMIVVGALALVVATSNASMPVIYVAAFILGLGEMLADTTMQTLIPSVVPAGELERANGRVYASQAISNEFVGPPAGSVVYAVAPAVPFALNAVTWGLAAVVLARLKVARPDRSAAASTSIRQDIVAGARYLFGHPILRAVLIWAVFVNASLTAYSGIYVLYALEVLGLSEAAYGFLTAVAGAGGVCGTLVAGRVVERLGRSRVVQVGCVVTGVAAAGAGLTSVPVIFGALIFLLTFSASLVIIVLVSLRQTIVPNAMLGRVTATSRAFAYGAIPAGALAGGWLAAEFGLQAPFIVGGAVVIVAGLAIGRFLTQERIEQARAEAQTG
jgi:MFS family permease